MCVKLEPLQAMTWQGLWFGGQIAKFGFGGLHFLRSPLPLYLIVLKVLVGKSYTLRNTGGPAPFSA
jgi:hypothetical protein